MDPAELDRVALQFIAEGVTELAGFEVAAIAVVRDGRLDTVAVAGDDGAREVMTTRGAPVEALMAELENAEDWGSLKFVPHEREGDHLTAYSWIPDLEISDAADAWHPHDLLCGLLCDDAGTLRGVLSIDVPRNGLRPGPEQRRILQLYVKQAERAVITALERGAFAREVEREHAVAEYRAQLVNLLSHEVQNPLTAILCNAELLLAEEGLTEDHRRRVDAIQRSAERIRVMGDDLLVLARVGDPDRTLDDVVDLVSVARGVCELLEAEGARRSVELELVAETARLLVRGDVQDLDALVANLVSNAVKYSEPGGRVTVVLRRAADGHEASAELAVEDLGVGISDGDRAHVFEEFFRSGDPRVRERPGTGLGLAIVHRVVTRHDGTVAVESEPQQGTRFVVRLPLADARAAGSGPAQGSTTDVPLA
jgi:signal transduction histidine kinase